MKKIDPHLGGHSNKTWIDRGSLKYMYDKYNVRSMIDIGCGPGDQVKQARNLGIEATGFDGDYTISPDVLIDFTKAEYTTLNTWDLAWSVEFVEHVEEKHMANYMSLFSKCKYIICTANPSPGPYHFNCKDIDYWIGKFEQNGFTFSQQILDGVLVHSTMAKKLGSSWLERTGMAYVNTKI